MTNIKQENDSAYELYLETLTNWARNYLGPLAKNNKPPKQREHEFFLKVFYGFSEITNTREAVFLCRTLINTAPPRSKKIQKDAYIELIISSYLHEIYILQLRLFKYLKTLKRIYKNIDDGTIKNNLDSLDRYVKKAFEGIVGTRGSHVHERRYSDESLKWLSSYTLLSRHSHEQEYSDMAKIAYIGNRTKWEKQMLENEKTIDSILNHYCDRLNKSIVHDGTILKPNKNYDI